MKNQKHLGICIDQTLHYKLTYIANYEGRTISGLFTWLFRQHIEHFEKKNGPIALPARQNEN